MTTSLSFLIFSADKLELWFPVKISRLLVTLVGVWGVVLSELLVAAELELKFDFGVISWEIVRPFLLKAVVERDFSN